MTIDKLGKSLLVQTQGLRWPEEALQRKYTGTSGQTLLDQAASFLGILDSLMAGRLQEPGWRGLDYGVGWGRMASLMTYFGAPQQLDCVDAWEKSLQLAIDHGIENKAWVVNAKLVPGELPQGEYDFVYAYSIYTHLPESLVINNTREIMKSLRPGGMFLLTVREPPFLDFLVRTNNCRPAIDKLDTEGYWFGNVQNPDYGDTILTRNWAEANFGKLGVLERLGPMKHEPTQVALVLRKVLPEK